MNDKVALDYEMSKPQGKGHLYAATGIAKITALPHGMIPTTDRAGRRTRDRSHQQNLLAKWTGLDECLSKYGVGQFFFGSCQFIHFHESIC